jgi:Family of unknown function (DUF6174)
MTMALRNRLSRPMASRACSFPLAAGLACLLAACDPAAPVPGDPPSDLAFARAKWSRQEPAAYSYSLRMVCFCPYDTILVTADRDSVLAAVATGRLARSGADTLPNPQDYSIDSLFAQLERMRKGHPRKLFYRFDPEYGFPDSVDYDGSAQIADEELTRTVFGFRPVPTR